MIHRSALIATASACLLFSFAGRLPAAGPSGPEHFFEERVRPLLVARCVRCHGPKRQEASLRLDSRAHLLRGGASGAAAVPGEPDESLLIEAVTRQGLEMPPEQPLSDREIAALRRWVQLGLPWPTEAPVAPALGDQQAISAAARNHWAFQPVVKPAAETLEVDPATPGAMIDALVRAKLKQQGLTPSPEADRRTLIRRASFDVLGLPPSYSDVTAFVNDPDPRAYEKLVDRLLKSPHYGERWGRHWLDIARYADTRDWRAQTDPRYPFAYTYRDYVIGALNDDKPYDQFLREQIAADFYTDQADSPTLAALGLLTVGPRFRDNQLEQVADRIDVVTRGLMALTVTCARCHDHKYDPIPIDDYYSLYGVFASTELPDEFPQIRGAEVPAALAGDYLQQRTAKVAALEKYGQDLRTAALTDLRNDMESYFRGYYEMAVTGKSQIRGLISKYKLNHHAMTPLAARLQRLQRAAAGPRHPVFGLWVRGMAFSEADFKQQFPQLLAAAQAARPPLNPRLAAACSPPTEIRGRLDLVLLYARVLGEVWQEWVSLKQEQPQAGELPDPDAEQLRQALLGPRGIANFEVDEVVRASRLLGAGRRKLGELETAIREVDSSHPGSPPRAMVVTEKSSPVEPFVMLRGEPQRRGARVPRRFLKVLAGKQREAFVEGSGRKELAEAIAAPDNPLTARVLVNRVWMRYFGEGLVTTPGDFGLRSQPPSHPRLLDWLAATFVEEGWSLKRLHRRILLSQTYRQTSTSNPQGQQLDPQNRLFWRANRKRLDFEAMRDAMLACSEQIDRTIGGRSVLLDATPFPRRRTLYGYIDRVETDPIFKIFDVASPDASSPQRPQTTVPQQALFAMNHPFVVEQARALAKVARSPETEPSEQVQRLYQRLFGRTADDDELQLALAFVQMSRTEPLGRPTASPWQYGYGPAEALAGSPTPAQPATAPPPTQSPTGSDPLVAQERQGKPQDGFTPLPHWDGTQYAGGPELPDPRLGHARLTARGGHPGRQGQAAIRRWVAPQTMEVTIGGTVTHRRDLGDGIRAQLLLDGRPLRQIGLLNDSATLSVEKLRVRQGQRLDFAVDCAKSPSADAFLWAPVIEELGVPAPRRWDAARDFAGPPPPSLNAWEQLAQALMLTNEFLYVD